MFHVSAMSLVLALLSLASLAAAIRDEAAQPIDKLLRGVGSRAASGLSKGFGRRGMHMQNGQLKMTNKEVVDWVKLHLGEDLYRAMKKGSGTRAYEAAMNVYRPTAHVTEKMLASYGQGQLGKQVTNNILKAHRTGANPILSAHGLGPNGQATLKQGFQRLQNSNFMKLLEKQKEPKDVKTVKKSLKDLFAEADALLKHIDKLKSMSLLQVGETDSPDYFEATKLMAETMNLPAKEVLVNSLMYVYDESMYILGGLVQEDWLPSSSASMKEALMSLSMADLEDFRPQIQETFVLCHQLIDRAYSAEVQALQTHPDDNDDPVRLEEEDLSKMEELE